jgi:hypothetical protein
VCNRQLLGEAAHINQLEVMDTRTISLDLGRGNESDMDTAFSMLWAIHQGALRASGATDREMEAIEHEAALVNKEYFDPLEGIETTYLACVLKRRV